MKLLKTNNLICRFVFSGIVGALTNFAIFYFLFDILNIHYLVSSGLAVIISLGVSFCLQKFVTFRNSDLSAVNLQVSSYLLVGFFNLVTNVLIVLCLVEWFDIQALPAQVLASLILAISSFCFYKFYIFKPSSQTSVKMLNDILTMSLLATVMTLIVFWVNGVYDYRVDAEIYLGQIESFSGGDVFNSAPGVMLRLFKPLYGFVGMLLVNIITSAQAILLINFSFLLILGASFFWLLSLFEFSRRQALIGTIWLVTAYPLLKYGLALSTDISGWALSTASIAFTLSAVKSNKDYRLIIASLISILGIFAKETGAVGFLFSFLTILYFYKKWGNRRTLKALIYLVGPVLFFVGSYWMILWGKAPSFIDWYMTNNRVYQNEYRTIKDWFLVEGSAFSFLWLLVGVAFVRVWSFWQKGIFFPPRFWQYMMFLFLVTLPVLMWPIFISRILFIQFLWVIPIALFGLYEVEKFTLNRGRFWLFWLIAFSPSIFSIGLFVASQGGSLYRFLPGF